MTETDHHTIATLILYQKQKWVLIAPPLREPGSLFCPSAQVGSGIKAHLKKLLSQLMEHQHTSQLQDGTVLIKNNTLRSSKIEKAREQDGISCTSWRAVFKESTVMATLAIQSPHATLRGRFLYLCLPLHRSGIHPDSSTCTCLSVFLLIRNVLQYLQLIYVPN